MLRNRALDGKITGLEITRPWVPEIFGRALRFWDLGARLTPNEKVRFEPFIYPGTEILDRAPELLYYRARLAPKKMLSWSPEITQYFLYGILYLYPFDFVLHIFISFGR